MKKLLLLLVLSVSAFSASAGDVAIHRTAFGSGHFLNEIGYEPAFKVQDGIYHAPQYMPGWPTAATIWPRVVEVTCDATLSKCEGYNYLPEMGRPEFLFFRPVAKKEAECCRPQAPPAPIIVYKEVPAKKPQE